MEGMKMVCTKTRSERGQARFPAGNVPPTFSKRERGPFPHAAEIGRFDRRSKAQAAIEFLTTYGWAVVVIAIVLVALVWLGVFNIASQVPDRCTIQGGLQCDSITLRKDSSGIVSIGSLVVTSRLPNPVWICGVGCDDNLQEVGRYTDCSVQGSVKLDPGEQIDLATALPRGAGRSDCSVHFGGHYEAARDFEVGDTYSGKLIILYNDGASYSSTKKFFGDISAKVQPG